MDPLAASALSGNLTIQALLASSKGGAPEASLLLALAGQDVELLLQALEPGSTQLQLPSGQTFTAQGELPYPPGTQLTVRIFLPTETGELRLQTLEAKPPASPSILAPLRQSEAASLMTRLQQSEPDPQLLPLLQLLRKLEDATPSKPPVAPEVPLASPKLPEAEALRSAIQNLPAERQQRLAQLLDQPAETPPRELAQALENWLRKTATPGTASDPEPLAARSQPLFEVLTPSQEPGKSQDQNATRADHPETAGKLAIWLQALLEGKEPSSKATAASPLSSHPRALFQDPSASSGKASHPESWDAWMRGATQALSDPSVSPREAPFHMAQAREGTAFFEVPLPWDSSRPLQIWVESDQENASRGQLEPTQRVLIGVHFSRLGDTRIGLVRRASGLQIRIWTEHPEVLDSERQSLIEELRGLGGNVDLQIQDLPPGVPSLRAQVAGSSLQALG